MKQKKWRNKNFFESFKNSLNGVKYTFQNERNLKIQFVFLIFAVMMAIFLELNNTEFAILFITIGFVIFAEIINTAIELILDLYSEEYNQKIKIVKDISSGAVLITAIVSIAVGIVLFLPKILEKLI